MNIRLAGNRDKAAWDTFVLTNEGASPYHCFAWREAVEKAYKHKGYYLMAEEEGNIIGILPLVSMRVPFLYNKVVSLPFCDIGGVLTTREDVTQHLYDEAIALARRLGAGILDLRSQAEIQALQNSGYSSVIRTDKTSMILNLPATSEALWDGFKSKLRSQVRKAEKNNLTFLWGERSNRRDFYRVFSTNMWELGSPVHSQAWINAVLDAYDQKARMGLVFHQNTPVGAGIILCQGGRVSIPWASTLREYNNLSPNMLLYWNFLQFAADSGCTQFDFGRSTMGEGTYRFKAQWGAEPQTLYWHSLDIHQSSTEKGTDGSMVGGKREFLASIWARLPLPVVNCIGPRLRRHISL